MNCSLLKRHIWVFISCFTVAFGSFGLWQYHLYQKLSKTDISCGSDWSYMVRCPIGSYCRSLGQGPLAGGLCKAWLSVVFEIFRGWGEQRRVSTPTPIPILLPTLTPEPISTPTPTSAPLVEDETKDWKTYINNELSFKYPPGWTTEMNRIIGTNPDVIIYVITKDSTLMNECMKLDTVEKKNWVVIKKFSRVTTGEMCSTNDPSPREVWVVPTKDDYSSGISYSYTTKDSPQAENVFDQILSTFKFLD